MSNPNISTAGFTFAASFYQMVSTLFADDPDVFVSVGHPGPAHEDEPDLLVFIDFTSKQDMENMSANHSRLETLEQQIFISSNRAGEDDDSDRIDRIGDILNQISSQLRTGDPTVGGSVLWCFMTQFASKGSTQPSVLAAGRQVDCVAIFTAVARIS